MRLYACMLLIGSVNAQFFESFETPRKTSQIEALGDQFGVRDALGAWSRVLRNIASRSKLSRSVTPPNPRDFTIPPAIKREDLEKIILTKNGGDSIINERLLYLLLPRIKGQSPFTSTTSSTTVTTTVVTTTTTPTSTTTSAPTSSSTTPTTPTSTTTSAQTSSSTTPTTSIPTKATTSNQPKIFDNSTTTQSSTQDEKRNKTKVKWSDEDTEEHELDSSELTLLEREYLKKLAHLKAEREERRNRQQLEFANDLKTTSAIQKTSDQALIAKEAEPPVNNTKKDQQLTVVFHTAAKDDYDNMTAIESKVLSILSKTIQEQEQKLAENKATKIEIDDVKQDEYKQNHLNEEVNEVVVSSSPQPEINKDTVSSANSVQETMNITLLRNNSIESKSSRKGNGTNLEESDLDTLSLVEISQSNRKHSKNSKSDYTSVTPISSIQEAKEVNEILSLIEADEEAQKSEEKSNTTELKQLRENIRAKLLIVLQKRVERLLENLDLKSTATNPTTTTTTPTPLVETTTISEELSTQKKSVADGVTSTMETSTLNVKTTTSAENSSTDADQTTSSKLLELEVDSTAQANSTQSTSTTQPPSSTTAYRVAVSTLFIE